MTLLILAAVVACISWTVTKEEVFKEPRAFCAQRSRECAQIALRKFFYLFTCEYCFSHYVALGVVWASGFRLLGGSVFAFFATWFALVWVANWMMTAFAILRQMLKGITAANRRAEP